MGKPIYQHNAEIPINKDDLIRALSQMTIYSGKYYFEKKYWNQYDIDQLSKIIDYIKQKLEEDSPQ